MSKAVDDSARDNLKEFIEAHMKEITLRMHMPWNPSKGYEAELDKLVDVIIKQAMQAVASQWSQDLLGKLWSGKVEIQDVTNVPSTDKSP